MRLEGSAVMVGDMNAAALAPDVIADLVDRAESLDDAMLNALAREHGHRRGSCQVCLRRARLVVAVMHAYPHDMRDARSA